ncbi:MAG: DUF4340 domain-containing protein [Treponema sp.]|nr:DUF4340 domain-containing protein [Treponema sp.]
MNVKKIIPPILIVFLAGLYAASFFPYFTFKGEKKFPVMETALLNSQYSEKLSEIKISAQNSAIILENNEGFWEGRAISNEGEHPVVHLFPADRRKIEQTIEDLQKIIQVQKVSSSKKNLSHFGLDDESAVLISYNAKGGATGTFSVGKTDFSQRARYILFPQYDGIFKTEFDFKELLYTAARQWYDPYIIPRSLFQQGSEVLSARILKDGLKSVYTPKNSESDRRLLELRHGSLGVWREQEVETSILFEMTSGEMLALDFAHTDDDVLVRAKSTSPDFEYCYHLSEWTYNNFLEILLH